MRAAVHRYPNHYRPFAGFTLVEVLVALVVLSIGLLGVAKLSLSSVQSNGSSYLRGQASALIQEMIDDMRANRTQAVAGLYQINFGAAAPNPGTDCSQVTSCSVSTLTAYDLYMWKQRLSTAFPGGALPAGDGQIVIASTVVNGQTETLATIAVEWNDSVAQCGLGASCATPLPSQVLTVETQL